MSAHNDARDWVRQLRGQGASYRAIAQAAGVGAMTVHDVSAGRGRARASTQAALLAVGPGNLTSRRVDAGGTRLRLRALHVMGHGSARLARAAGVSEQTVRALVRGDARTVSPRIRDAVTDVYDAWWDKRAPERTRAERAAASAARRRAIAGHWCPPAAMDDDQLDEPGYQPRAGWRPARGTGTATSTLNPRAPRSRRDPVQAVRTPPQRRSA
jgi:transcriptional regulator with XRE-family HTH domain